MKHNRNFTRSTSIPRRITGRLDVEVSFWRRNLEHDSRVILYRGLSGSMRRLAGGSRDRNHGFSTMVASEKGPWTSVLRTARSVAKRIHTRHNHISCILHRAPNTITNITILLDRPSKEQSHT